MAYQPSAEAYWSSAGSLEYFLTERYYLYAADRRGQVYRAAVHHPPWPLQPAEADIVANTVAGSLGIALPETPPLLHYAHRMDVLTWALERI